MSKLETITIDTPSGSSALQIGDGNTATIGLGKSGDTLTVPSGATLSIAGTINASSGTATGFGETNEPYFLATGNGTQSLTEDLNTVIQYNVLRDSLDSASGYNTSTYTYTVQSGGAGFWYIAAGNYLQSLSQDKQADIQIHVSGQEYFVNRYRPGAQVNQFMQVHGIHKLTVGTTLLVKIFHNDNSARNAVNTERGSFFGGFRIKAL
jgi:hypothetical protein|tara:strand:- start:38 stop:661 length:624 start_codon:yes stop_codon:yes gene_type:complete